MTTKIAYVDESHDPVRFCLSALVIDAADRPAALEQCLQFRRYLRDMYGIKVRSELHSQPLVAGIGRSFATRTVSKWERSQVFAGMLQTAAFLPNVKLFNVALLKNGRRDPQIDAWDRLLNRLEKNAQVNGNSEKGLLAWALRQGQFADESAKEQLKKHIESICHRVLVVADEGHEYSITRAFRRMHRYNFIPSQHGAWEDGSRAKNLTLTRYIEEPVFRSSDSSHFLQLADAIAFGLLKKESKPTPKIKKYGIHKMFDQFCADACETAACKYDPLGIVRS